MCDIYKKTIREIAAEIRDGSLSIEDIALAVTENLEKKEKKIHAYITTTTDEAKEQAQKIARRKHYPMSPLFGIPISVKDSLTTKGIKTTVASRILENFIPPYDATAYARLKKTGTILLGKTNMDEFAHGFTTEYSAFGPTKNPWNEKMAPGGSSGGAAASIASGGALLALATENWGSIIQPASLCGVVGMKPTYGRSSRYGIIAMVSSLDCPGILGRCVEDVAIGIEAISGFDPLDATSMDKPIEKYDEELTGNVHGKKIGYVKQFLMKAPEEIAQKIEDTTKVYENLGVSVEEIPWYEMDVDHKIYDVLYRSEVSSNLARYDGIRFGHRSNENKDLDKYYMNTRDMFGKAVKRQIVTDPITLHGGDSNIYSDALRMRRHNRDYIDSLFKKYDAIITPATMFTELEIGKIFETRWRNENREMSRITAAMLAPAPLYGYPTMSFPVGFSKNNMPIGINMFSKRFGEQQLLNLAYAFQEKTGLKFLTPE